MPLVDPHEHGIIRGSERVGIAVLNRDYASASIRVTSHYIRRAISVEVCCYQRSGYAVARLQRLRRFAFATERERHLPAIQEIEERLASPCRPHGEEPARS